MKIPFEAEYRRRYHDLLEEVFDSDFLSEGRMVRRFETEMSACLGGPETVAVCNAGLGLLALLEAAGVGGGEVIVPSNTFMATPLAAIRAGADVVFADCNREDLCLSLTDLKTRITSRTRAVIVVHIGGHIAFEIEEMAAYLAERDIALIEDCAHAHGAEYNGRQAGTYGLGGVYSFYATKTMPLGEGGLVVTRDARAAEFVRSWRNYGKYDYKVSGFNARMNEMTAALGLVQLERLPRILAWKRDLAAKYDRIFEKRVRLPRNMVSGYYKYIVFERPLAEETGRVFDSPCHEIMGRSGDGLANTDWVKSNHACAPIYYGWDRAESTPEALAAHLLS
ncbi:MAG: DegT/DnrJ/EryC1/StrS family aminotransferase [Proteobacteria bacterium]|nr:DegT/DnrJ/EryC1/StrS family aminotransferase [Pseudomonadota bacterium]